MTSPKSVGFRKMLGSPKGRVFMLSKLPLAFIAGVKIESLHDESCTTSIRYKWINKNPFRSLYFAALHMAAELSTGLILFEHYISRKDFSMLVIKTEAEYHKKAIGNITFVCKQVKEVSNSIETLKDQDILPLHSVAVDSTGEIVAEFTYHWSLKKRPRR